MKKRRQDKATEKRQTKAAFLSLVQTPTEKVLAAKIGEILSLKGITTNQCDR